MDHLALATLAYFRDDERYLNGQVIDWKDVDYRVMWFVAALRRELDAPITLIRGNHGWQGTAVDWCCPGVSYKKVAMAVALLRNPTASVAEVCKALKVSRATLYRYLPLAANKVAAVSG